MALRQVEVKFKIWIDEVDSRLNRGRLRNEMSLFAQHMLEAYDSTLVDATVDGELMKYPMMPDENNIN